MTLSCSQPFSKKNYGPGIYINEVTIADVQDISGQLLPPNNLQYDIAIRLHLEIGRDFQPEFVIGGNFKHDPITDDVIGWGGAFVVQEALSKLGYEGKLDSNNGVPVDILESLVGKTFLRLSYVSGVKESGKLRYSDWNNIATLEDGAESLSQRFRKSLTKGYPRNYHPDILDMPVENVDFPPVTVHEEVF